MQGKADAFDWNNVGGVTHFDFVVSKDEEDGKLIVFMLVEVRGLIHTTTQFQQTQKNKTKISFLKKRACLCICVNKSIQNQMIYLRNAAGVVAWG